MHFMNVERKHAFRFEYVLYQHSVWDTVRFPFSKILHDTSRLRNVAVRAEHFPRHTYTCSIR